MLNSENNKKLLAPLMDRLTNEELGAGALHSHQVLRQLKESVRSDLEHLLNTRYRCMSPGEEYPHLQGALVNFGRPDLSTVNLTSAVSRRKFCMDLEETILAFEPRIKSVSVSSEEDPDADDPFVRFRIEAKLHVNPAAEVIVFDSSMNPINHTIDVKEIA